MASGPRNRTGDEPTSTLTMKTYRLILVLSLIAVAVPCRAAENDLQTPPPPNAADTNGLETLRTYLQLQEQIHATQLAIEENRRELTIAAARNAESVATRLQTLEQALVTQRERELEAIQGSQRVLLTVAGGIATLGFLAMLLMAWSHWRTMNRFAEIAVELPTSRRLGPATPRSALALGDPAVIAVGSTQEMDGRLLGAIDRLEKRIYELEHTAHGPLAEPKDAINDVTIDASAGTAEPKAKAGHLGQIAVLLGKGQSLLNIDKAEEALECFDQVLAMNENHAEALVKKGTALERLRKNNEAIACYDRAIAADSSMTIAYLYKGGLFNRLERFTEAIECYEKALRTQDKGAQA